MPAIAVTTESPIRKYSDARSVLMRWHRGIAFEYRLQEFPEPVSAP